MKRVLDFLRHEPVAVWGALATIVLAVLPPLGVPAIDVTYVGVALAAVGVPVVRAKVTPTLVVDQLLTVARNLAHISRPVTSNPEAKVTTKQGQ